MKKLSLIILALVMTLSLAACAAAKPTMVDVTTDQGISFKLPSDMVKQASGAYANPQTGDSVSFGLADVAETPLSGWKAENVLATYAASYTDVVVKSFENGKQINGKEALVAKVTLKSQAGTAITSTLVMVTTGTENYIVTFNYASNNTDGSLVKNLQSCIDSIKIK